MPASSLRGLIEPWPSGDLGSDDPLTPRVTRAVMNNTSHLVDSQCQHIVQWVRLSGTYRTLAGAPGTTTPALVWRGRVPITRRPDGRFAQWVVQLLVSSATAGAVTWRIGARAIDDVRRPPLLSLTDASVSANSTTPVWTAPMLVRPRTEGREERLLTSLAVGASEPLVVTVGVGWAMLGIWATGAVIPRLSGVSAREFCA